MYSANSLNISSEEKNQQRLTNVLHDYIRYRLEEKEKKINQ